VVDPIAKNLLAYFPNPTNPSAAAGTLNFVGNLSQTADDNTHLARIDHNISDKDRLTGRYIWFGGTTLGAGTLPNNGTSNSPGSQNLALTETHTFSPTFFLETRAGFSRNKTDFKVQDAGFNAATIFPGVPGVVNGSQNVLDSGLPRVAITGGYASLGGATNLPQGRITNTYELFFNFTKVAPFGASRHTLKFGYTPRREETRRFLDGNSRGAVTFADFDHFAGTCSACNGQALLLNSTISTGETLSHWYRYAHALYVQDDIKLKPNLTVNIGLRYEIPSVMTEKRGRGTNFIPGVGPVLFGGNRLLNLDPTKSGPSAFFFQTSPVSLNNAGTTPDNNNFGPLFGFAYTPKFGKGWLNDGKTVIRGGFRVGFDEIFNNIPANFSLSAPFFVTTTQRAGTTQPAAGYGYNLAFNQNVPLGGLISYNAYDAHAPTAYAYNWNFGIQRQLTNTSSIDVSYIGSEGHKLGIYLDANEPTVTVKDPTLHGITAPNVQTYPFPQWNSAFVGSLVGNSNYHGLVISSKMRMKEVITMNNSYTWSHAIDNSSAFFSATTDFGSPDDSRNLRAERGNSANDQRHRFVNAFVLDVPVGKGRAYLGNLHGIGEQLLGGWTVSGITNLATGNPFTVYSNTAVDFSGFNSFSDRPDLVSGTPLTLHEGNPDNFFDPAYFGKVAGAKCPGQPAYNSTSGCAPTGRVGSEARNAFYGPGLISFDMTAGKTFRIRERLKLEYRADFFNVLNHTNFGLTSGNRTVSSGTFGQLSKTSSFNGGDTGGPRVIQMTLRLQF
jgi:hypothetical protein